MARGLAAGAAGTCALNATTYLDMVVRGRAASSIPEQTVEALADRLSLPIPGSHGKRENRISGLAPLLGIAAGVGTGAVLGAVRMGGWRPGPRPTAALCTLAAMLAGNVPMTGIGVTDPREWSAADWLSDVVPHLAYGAVAAAVLTALDRDS